ncbi:MAG: cell division ATPase MinD, partial [Haloferacaceae archaeon]
MGRVYAVASGKGGVGKTTTTANLGAALAAAGHRTAVVDADLGMANLGAAFGLADDGPTLHDVLAGVATVTESIREAADGLAVVPGSRALDAFADASPDGLADVLGTLADEYEYVVVDTGAGLSTDSLEPLRAADEVVLVTTPERAALDDTTKTAAVTRRLGTPLRGYVLVRGGDEAGERARDRLDGDVLGTIPDDPTVSDALAAGKPLAAYAPRSPATGAYRRLAATLTGVSIPDVDAPDADATGAGPDGTTTEPTSEDSASGDAAAPDESQASDSTPDGGGTTDDGPVDRSDEATAVDSTDAEGASDPDAADADGAGVAIDAEGDSTPAEDPDDEAGILVEPAGDERADETTAEDERADETTAEDER